MALTGGFARIRILNKIDFFKGFHQLQTTTTVQLNRSVHAKILRQYLRFSSSSSSSVQQILPGQTLTQTCKKEKIAHKSSSSSSSSSDSESDENGRLVNRTQCSCTSSPVKELYTHRPQMPCILLQYQLLQQQQQQQQQIQLQQQQQSVNSYGCSCGRCGCERSFQAHTTNTLNEQSIDCSKFAFPQPIEQPIQLPKIIPTPPTLLRTGLLIKLELDVTVEYVRGLPQITIPLPSRRERCKFTLKPITNTVGDLIAMVKNEDHGIDRVVATSMDDTRIAASNTIENLLEEDFKLIINDHCYIVRTPKQNRITGEEAQRLSDIKTLVSQLYEALNVQEHNIQTEKNLSSQLEILRQQVLPMEEQKAHLDMIAQRKSDWMSWIGLGLMSVQFGILARLTWWEYSWDIMEPITYFVTYGTAMAAYAYFVVTKQEYVLKDVKDRQQLLTIHKRAKKAGLDLTQYNALKEQISQLERDLYKMQNPLKLHMPKDPLQQQKASKEAKMQS